MQRVCIQSKRNISSLLKQWEFIQMFCFDAVGILSILEAGLPRALCSSGYKKGTMRGKAKCSVT